MNLLLFIYYTILICISSKYDIKQTKMYIKYTKLCHLQDLIKIPINKVNINKIDLKKRSKYTKNTQF